VGHVLGHYGNHDHAVLDKYETAAGVINEDITTWQTEERFDLILSISTFEHIGFDDDATGGSADKILAAIAACRKLLNPQGRLAITVPLGYNPDLDRLIECNALGEDRGWFLLRHGPREWKEVARHQAMGTPFGRPFPFANGLLVAEFDASD
jgi:SAM-dependent methyltransferase